MATSVGFLDAEREKPRLSVGQLWGIPTGSNGSTAPVRNSVMQPFSCHLAPDGSCDPRTTAISGLCFHSMFGERRLSKGDRSLGRNCSTDAFGSAATVRRQWEHSLAGPRRRAAVPPMRPAAAERQVPRYSGQPSEEQPNVRYRRPPTFARQIRPTATSLKQSLSARRPLESRRQR
jgi:hypothetical protein